MSNFDDGLHDVELTRGVMCEDLTRRVAEHNGHPVDCSLEVTFRLRYEIDSDEVCHYNNTPGCMVVHVESVRVTSYRLTEWRKSGDKVTTPFDRDDMAEAIEHYLIGQDWETDLSEANSLADVWP